VEGCTRFSVFDADPTSFALIATGVASGLQPSFRSRLAGIDWVVVAGHVATSALALDFFGLVSILRRMGKPLPDGSSAGRRLLQCGMMG
jgi:hypothetical protein